MAKNTLPTNFIDDRMAESMNDRRRYQMIQNSDGTVSFVDVTAYEVVGSDYGAGNINATNTAVNESEDKNKRINDMDTIMALTQAGYYPDALMLKEVNNNLDGLTVVQDDTGKITGYKTNKGGADTVFPFSASAETVGEKLLEDYTSNFGSKTGSYTATEDMLLILLLGCSKLALSTAFAFDRDIPIVEMVSAGANSTSYYIGITRMRIGETINWTIKGSSGYSVNASIRLCSAH